MVVAPNSPHEPAYAAKRYENRYQNARLPYAPSFNEADVSDKPLYIRQTPRYGPEALSQVRREYQARIRSLESVDDLMGTLVGRLAATGQLDNTYVVYASDNGYMLGRHRIKSKGVPYEESIKVPFYVRGPGVSAGAREEIVGNTDWAPTIADWAGAPLEDADGRSFAPLLSGETPTDGWRDALLVEFFHAHPFSALRTADRTYVEYDSGEKELYDLPADPYQLNSRHADPAYAEEKAALAARLEALKGCAEDSCRAAEDGVTGSTAP